MTEVLTPNQLSAVAETLRGLVGNLDPGWIADSEAPALWKPLEEICRLASGAQVVLAASIDRSDAPAMAGLRNGAEWIAQHSGGSLRSAYDAVTTSKRLGELAVVSAALRDGRLSVVQASVVADAVVCDPSAECRLVDLAPTVSLGELRHECLRVKAAADPDPEGKRKRIQRERRLRWFVDNEGAFNLSGRGPIHAGSELATVLAPIIDDIFAVAREAGIAEARDAYTWDALVEMARMAWAYMHGHTADADTADADTAVPADGEPADENLGAEDAAGTCASSTDDGSHAASSGHPADNPSAGDDVGAGTSRAQDCGTDSSADGAGPAPATDAAGAAHDSDDAVGRPRRRRRATGVNPWLRMAIRVDHSALVRGRIEGEETCEISGVGPVPVRVARDLLGDAVLHLVVTKSRDVASVTYLGRGMNTAQKVAAAWAQPECQRLGCHRPVMEWDHRVPWAEQAETRTGNMQGLCRPDHRLKTEHGWDLVDGVGKRPMVPPTDARHPANTRRGPPDRSPSDRPTVATTAA